MLDGMQCDPIQGQSKGHEPQKVGKSTVACIRVDPPQPDGTWSHCAVLTTV